MFLEKADDNFEAWVMEDPVSKGVVLDLVFTKKEGLVGDLKVGGNLGYSYLVVTELLEFEIP